MKTHTLYLSAFFLGIISLLSGGLFFLSYQTLPDRIRECAQYEPKKQQCYQSLVETVAHDDGIAAGFDVLGLLYETDTQFASYCHGTTHELGKIAYESFRLDQDFSISADTSYCGFGFYHGFMEAMLYDTGDLSHATDFCEYVDRGLKGTINGVSFACYHGIGHGVVDGTDPSLWSDIDRYIEPGLSLCEALPTAVLEHKTRCASGVFNALAIAYRNPKYTFRPDPEDPYEVCRRQKVAYARKACYDQMNGYVNFSSTDFREALMRAFRTAEPAYRELAVETTAGYRVLDALRKELSFATLIADCEVLPDAYARLCARGIAAATIEHGKPGREYETVLDACMESSILRDQCLAGVAIGVYDRLPPPLREALCSDIRARAGEAAAIACERTMQGPESGS